MVDRTHKEVDFPTQAQKVETNGPVGCQVERLGSQLLGQVQGFGVIPYLPGRQSNGLGRAHTLHRLSSLTVRRFENRSQRFVSLHEDGKSALQPGDIERTGQSKAKAVVVLDANSFQQLQEPKTTLGQGERRRTSRGFGHGGFPVTLGRGAVEACLQLLRRKGFHLHPQPGHGLQPAGRNLIAQHGFGQARCCGVAEEILQRDFDTQETI